MDSNHVIAIVLGGGKGTRLYPLTKVRSKPAVPFGGKYRLVDIPISNCINAGFKQIFILTQFNSVSLHQHLSNTYIFDVFSNGFVEILAAEQNFNNNSGWYEGTADAVRKNFSHLHDRKPSHYIILSGDQLYSMDLRDMFNKHVESKAKITIACHPVSRTEAAELGILSTDDKGRIQKFLEKPGLEANIDEYRIPEKMRSRLPKLADKEYLGSMGMYIFDAETLDQALDNEFTDFGKEIIPYMIQKSKVNSYVYEGYWEDIGTIRSFYDANINLATVNPEFNFYDEKLPIYTHRRHLPATKINFCTISQSLAAEGSIITNANIMNSVIGIRRVIESGTTLSGVITLGAKYYETEPEKQRNREKGIPNIGIGRNCSIKNTIIDQNARIGENCSIGYQDIPRADGDYGSYCIKDGIIVIVKEAIIPNGTVI